ncbi:hypothetical protein [Vibrio aerogenes]|uniref:hypothetical protein n=1 Tax=Vibrio aerogenes TaxID=92172 RepID=UPI00111477EF|nr:hypothetical protein [Vibrio aerogenes]
MAGAITFSSGWMLLCGGKHLTQLWLSIAIGSIIFGSFFLYFPIKPWIVYFFQSKKNPPQDHLAAIPWEEVSIEFHQLSAVSYVGPRSMYQLSIRCPLPDESERAFTIGLPVYSQQEAFCLYELIRDYMEHGAKGLEHTAAAELQTEAPDYGRAAYWREVKQHLKNPLTYPFWQLWSLISLRPFAHWYMEYLLDVLPKKNIHREAAIQWSQPIPESEWAKPSEQLQEANRRVRELYVKGLDWESPEVQAVLREYERV